VPPQELQDPARIDDGAVERRLEGEGLVEIRQGGFELLLRGEQASPVVVAEKRLGVPGDERGKVRLRLPEIPLLEEQRREVDVGFVVLRILRYDPLVERGGLLLLPRGGEDAGQQVPGPLMGVVG
jgi:hypothetical protein